MPTRFNAGTGRKVLLKEPIPLQLAVTMVKEHTGLADVAVAVASGESTGEFGTSLVSFLFLFHS